MHYFFKIIFFGDRILYSCSNNILDLTCADKPDDVFEDLNAIIYRHSIIQSVFFSKLIEEFLRVLPHLFILVNNAHYF